MAEDIPPGEHLLVTVLGINLRLARYRLGEAEAEAPIAPAALLDLLPEDDRPSRVIALCTEAARQESLPVLTETLAGQYEVTAVDLPDFEVGEDAPTYLDTALQKVVSGVPRAAGTKLTLDLTHGFRHFTFLTYMATLYVNALRGVEVRGAYYGLLRNDQQVHPFLDIRPLLELPRWVHAVTVLGDTGSALPISELLGRSQAGAPDPTVSQVADSLRHVSDAYLSGLPLELGHAVHRAVGKRKPLHRVLRDRMLVPQAQELTDRLLRGVHPYLLSPGEKDNWKREVPLSREELGRQAALVNELWQRGAFVVSLGLMREWAVSWTQWRLGWSTDWLERSARQRAERWLGALGAMVGEQALYDDLSYEQKQLACFWKKLTELRNAYHHHGMRHGEVSSDSSIHREVREQWESTFQQVPELSLELPGSYGGTLLISPVGSRPGVLLSAVHAVREAGYAEPAHCLLVCSAETEPRIPEALERSQYAGPWQPVQLVDPHGGVAEIESLVRDARRTLVGADQVLVNLTGGTTLIGIAVAQMAEEASRFARPVRRFGVFDRRSPEEQKADPYQVGESYWIDEEVNRAGDG